MTDAKDPRRYDDMLHLPHPEPRRHPRMAMEKRAAQFSPFAALTGHEDAIMETARLTEAKAELDENTKAILDAKLQELQYIREEGGEQEASFTWFQPDRKKDGGSYSISTGIVKKIDAVSRKVVLMDGQEIPVDDIRWIETG